MRLLSIASTWSLTLYCTCNSLAGLGLRPKPRRSTANNLQSPRMEDSRNTVSAQKDDDDVKPCTKMAFSGSGVVVVSPCVVPAASANLPTYQR
jgi:hypothetical protein